MTHSLGRVGAGDTLRDDGATADVDRNVTVAQVADSDVLTLTLDLCVGPVVVESVLWQIAKTL